MAIMRDQAENLLRGGEKGVAEWNWRRAESGFTLNLNGAYLRGAALHGVDLHGVEIRHATLERAYLLGADLSGANLSGANLSEADLRRANLFEANLSWANLSEADLRRANLFEANLIGVDLRGANLAGANFRGVDLRGANLAGANFRGVDLSGADLRVFNLAGATLTGAKLEGVRITPENGSTFSASFLDLATAEGLHDVDPVSRGFVEEYVSRVLGYIAGGEIAESGNNESFFLDRLEKIRMLRRLFREVEDPPDELIRVVEIITNELIEHLKSHPEEMNNIRPRQFEELIAEILASYGWDVQLTPETQDGGYDIFAISKDNAGVQTSWIIECKKYAPHRKVGVDIARSLFGVKGDLNVGMSMLATTSHFTKGVKKYKASRYDLELKDYEGVLEWVNEYRPNPNGRLYLKGNRLVVPGDEE
jgi:hypothetical protein